MCKKSIFFDQQIKIPLKSVDDLKIINMVCCNKARL